MRRTIVALSIVASSWTATQPGILDPLLRLFSSIWDQPYAKEGCGLDPWGVCKSAPVQPPQTDSGCGLDPWGACK